MDVARFDYAAVDWNMTTVLAAAKEQFYRISLEQDDVQRVGERASVSLEYDEQVKGWLAANLPFDYFSQKQLRHVVQGVTDRLLQVNGELSGKLALVKFMVREKAVGLIERETDKQTEAAFKKLFDSKKLCFFLECLECRFEIPPQIEVRAMRHSPTPTEIS